MVARPPRVAETDTPTIEERWDEEGGVGIVNGELVTSETEDYDDDDQEDDE